MSIQTINPATNKTVRTFEEMAPEDVDAAVAKAERTFQVWRKTTYEQRAALLHKVAGLMRERKVSLAKLITTEMGKLISQAQAEIILSADIIDYYAANGAKFLADKPLSPTYGSAFIRYSPIGVLLGVILPGHRPIFHSEARSARGMVVNCLTWASKSL